MIKQTNAHFCQYREVAVKFRNVLINQNMQDSTTIIIEQKSPSWP